MEDHLPAQNKVSRIWAIRKGKQQTAIAPSYWPVRTVVLRPVLRSSTGMSPIRMAVFTWPMLVESSRLVSGARAGRAKRASLRRTGITLVDYPLNPRLLLREGTACPAITSTRMPGGTWFWGVRGRGWRAGPILAQKRGCAEPESRASDPVPLQDRRAARRGRATGS